MNILRTKETCHHTHTKALFTLHSYMTLLSPPSLTPNDKRQKAENSCSNPQSLHLIGTNAICLPASRGSWSKGDEYRKSCGQDPAQVLPQSQSTSQAQPLLPYPKIWDQASWTSSDIYISGSKRFPMDIHELLLFLQEPSLFIMLCVLYSRFWLSAVLSKSALLFLC